MAKTWQENYGSFKNLERKVDDCEIEVLDSGSPDDVDDDVLEAGADVVVDGRDDGVGADDGAADDARALSEAQQHQRSSLTKAKTRTKWKPSDVLRQVEQVLGQNEEVLKNPLTDTSP